VAVFRYLTHPQVAIDPAVPVPQWGLSEVGRGRAEAFARSSLLAATTRVVASDEVKAKETAAIIAASLGLDFSVEADMDENDRSSTGFLPKDAFEAMADRFFARPDDSAEGWETARAAQIRVVGAFERLIRDHGDGDLLAVGHGAVGTLLYCHLAGLDIDRRHDQPAGGGNLFAVDPVTRMALHGWKPLEAFDG